MAIKLNRTGAIPQSGIPAFPNLTQEQLNSLLATISTIESKVWYSTNSYNGFYTGYYKKPNLYIAQGYFDLITGEFKEIRHTHGEAVYKIPDWGYRNVQIPMTVERLLKRAIKNFPVLNKQTHCWDIRDVSSHEILSIGYIDVAFSGKTIHSFSVPDSLWVDCLTHYTINQLENVA